MPKKPAATGRIRPTRRFDSTLQRPRKRMICPLGSVTRTARGRDGTWPRAGDRWASTTAPLRIDGERRLVHSTRICAPSTGSFLMLPGEGEKAGRQHCSRHSAPREDGPIEPAGASPSDYADRESDQPIDGWSARSRRASWIESFPSPKACGPPSTGGRPSFKPHTSRTFSARGPFGPLDTSNVTRCPSSKLSNRTLWHALRCRK